MSRFAAPNRNDESRKALEERARQAAMPASVEGKRKWPFPVANEAAVEEAFKQAVSETNEHSKKSTGRNEHKSDY